VNTRRNRAYETEVAEGDELFERLVVRPLAQRNAALDSLPILNTYWCDQGVEAAPIFEGVQDVEYLTGASVLKSHSAYFSRPSFQALFTSTYGDCPRELGF
jgi:hypothetical protein